VEREELPMTITIAPDIQFQNRFGLAHETALSVCATEFHIEDQIVECKLLALTQRKRNLAMDELVFRTKQCDEELARINVTDPSIPESTKRCRRGTLS
jgi:hypothetical protein